MKEQHAARGESSSERVRNGVLVVLGMHRSGTSAAARVFNLLGAAFPGKPLTGGFGIDTGHWEPESLVRLNDHLLAEGGSGWNDWRRFDFEALTPERYRFFRDEISRTIKEEFGSEPLVVLKDPRICRLVPLYGELLEEADRETYYVLPFRNPLSVVASLEKRDEMTRRYGSLLWLRHILDAEFSTRGCVRCFFEYDDFIADWREQVAQIARTSGFHWPHAIAEVALEVNGYLSKELQHHAFSTADLDQSPEFSSWIKNAFRALRTLADDPADAGALEALDQIRAEFDAGTEIFGEATIPEIQVRERKAGKSAGYWKALATKLAAEADGSAGETGGSSIGPKYPGHTNVGLLTIMEGKSRSDEGSAELARLANELDACRRAIRTREEELTEIEARALDLSVDLASSRQELGRILQSRSFRLAQRMQSAYSRSPMLRRIANTTFVAGILGARQTVVARPAAEISLVARQKIQASGLFDETFYRQHYAAHIREPDDLIADFLSSDPGQMRDPGPLFSTRFYLNTHVDVAASGMNPLAHFVLYGSNEGRIAFSPEKVRRFLSRVDTSASNSIFDVVPRGSSVTVLYAENGNFFFRDIAEYVAKLLTEEGCPARTFTDLPEGVDPASEVVVVVAPHEFFFIGPGKGWSPERVSQAAHVNTEQWQTPWFAKCFHQLTSTLRGVLDINPNSAAGLVKLGAKAAFLPIVPIEGSVFEQKRTQITPAFAKLKYIRPLDYPDDIDDRTYDIAYVAVSNPRRNKALAELARHIAPYRSFIHSPRFNRPIRRDDLDMLSGNDLTQIARNTKILLNIHRDHVGYLEWHRIFVYGVMNGCVVVTEPCFDNEHIKDGRNYLSASLAEMPTLMKELLETDGGRKRLRDISRNNMLLSRSLVAGNRFLR